MKTGVLGLVFVALMTWSCGDDGGGSSGGDPVPVKSICTKIMECGGWGWGSQADCEAGFIGNAQLGTECQDEAGYKSCMSACVPKACAAFQTCEGECWTDNC